VNKRFAIPLDASSKQTGDISFAELVDSNMDVTFQLTNAAAGATNSLDLMTSKGATVHHHSYMVSFSGTTASRVVGKSDIAAIFAEAYGGDWDYIEASWTVGAIDTPENSNLFEVQGGNVYDSNGWPPRTS
jgi:hypothetical protein